MKWGVRAKLFAISVGLIGCAGLISAVFLEAKLRAWFEAELEQELIEKSYMVNEAIQMVVMPHGQPINYDQLADQMGAAAKARVTLFVTMVGCSAILFGRLRSLIGHPITIRGQRLCRSKTLR